MELLQIKNLTFRYPEAKKKALDQIDLTVRAGEFAVLCGQSGCGKSTLLKLLKRELAPYGEKTGEIFLDGVSLEQTDPRRAASDIGFVLQDPESQIVTDTVWHELAFGLENLGLPSGVIRRRVAEMAGYFGIEDWFHKKTAQLSGGQKQLLNLASVMAMNPRVLLLDEPTAQLDPIAASHFISTLQKLNRELGLTVLLAEHRLEEVFPSADRVLLMEEGRLRYAGSPRKIANHLNGTPNHPMLAGLPAATRIFHLLEETGESPITVREGRDFIARHYLNRFPALPEQPYRHSPEKEVELKEVWFRYERELPDVMKGTSLTVYRGEHFCIVGGNGTGKTTALGIMAGLLKPYRGKVLINGRPINAAGNSLYKKNIALLPQNPQTVFLEKTVYEDLQGACKTMEYAKEEGEAKIAEIVSRLGIQSVLSMHPYDLSGGEQQKAALAKLLLLQPKLLLLDEPTKGIDAHAKLILSDIIGVLKKDGITVITVTHDVEFAAAAADRLGMFFDGGFTSVDRPVAFFSENSFYTTCANRIARGYFDNAILCEQVAELCRQNGKKGEEQ